MTDLLQTGSDWLADQLATFASRPVVYVRGAQQVTVRATVGHSLLKLSDGAGGVRMERTDRDFLIPAADLVLGGVPVLPQRGDRIRETQGTTVYVFEVMAPAGEPPWRWSDAFRRLLRIHAKQTATEAV